MQWPREPGRLLRGGLWPVRRSGYCPFDGGKEELSGVLAGRFQLPDQRQDEVILLRVAQRAEVDALRHTELESSCP